MTKVSIIVPCFNQGEYLEECLESILNQTFVDWECIIVNDGSSDHTEDIAQLWIAKDKRFRYFYKSNGGLSSARNFGLNSAMGQWILFLDCDDYIAHDKLEIITRIEDHVNLIISDFVFVSNGKTINHTFNYSVEAFNYHNILYNWDISINIPIHSALFRADYINDIRFNETFKAKEDWIFWLTILKTNTAVYYQNKIKSFYRINPTSMTKSKTLMLENTALAYAYIYENLLENESERLDYFKHIIHNFHQKMLGTHAYLAIHNRKKNRLLNRLVNKFYHVFNID